MAADDGGRIRALADALRKACHPRAWSRGVLLARDGVVEGKEESADEIVLAVRVPERPVPLTVVFYLETLEWDCECAAAADACAHAAGAVIALLRAREAGLRFPAADRARPTLRYRFRREGRTLLLERLLVQPDGALSLFAGEAARQQGLALDEIDLRVEPLIARGAVEVTRVEQALKLLTELEDSKAVYLEDRAVRTSRLGILPLGRVEQSGDGALFSIVRDPRIEEVAGDGVVRVGEVLHPIGEVGLVGAQLEKLPIHRKFARAELAELVAEVLPLYQSRCDLQIVASNLPRLVDRGRPRIALAIDLGPDSISATPELVYGDPPQLRIEEKRPVYLQGPVPKRDHAQERRLIEELRSGLNLTIGRRVTVRGAEAPAFLHRLRMFQRDQGGELEEALVPRLIPRFELEDDRFTLEFSTAPEGEEEGETPKRADPLQVLRAYESGGQLVPLLGGGWGEIPRGFLEAHGDQIALLLQLRGADGRVPPLALPALASLAEALDRPPPAALARLAPIFHAFERVPEAPLPEDLTATLRPYQKQGVDWLCFLRGAGLGAVLADDMGLGKTLQALCAIQGRTLIVCPTSVLPNWTAEIRRFRPRLKICLYHGPDRALDPSADVTLTTYALLRIDAERLSGAALEWDTAILDEAHMIKNAESQTARAAHGLRAKWRVALTGTPVENRLEELWSQLHFTNPGLLHGRAEFSERFAKPIAQGDAAMAARLRERIRPFVLRRLKREVAKDLPPRTDMVLFAELDETERALYQSVLLATKREVALKLAAGGGALAALEALLRLRQAACHPGLLPGQAAESSSKLATLLESLVEVVAEGHKALVFSQWTSLLDLLEPELARAELPFLRLDGSTRDRGAVVAEFQSEAGPPVLIISLKAGGTGLNLTAADHVFLLDPWWNPAVEDQAADRTHRIGQTRPVMVYRLVSRDTIEERVLELQAKKRAVADVALGEAQAAAALTKDDLLALLD